MFVLYSSLRRDQNGRVVLFTRLLYITEYGIVSLSGLALFQVPWCIQ